MKNTNLKNSIQQLYIGLSGIYNVSKTLKDALSGYTEYAAVSAKFAQFSENISYLNQQSISGTADTDTIDLIISQHQLKANAIISDLSGNALSAVPASGGHGGLFIGYTIEQYTPGQSQTVPSGVVSSYKLKNLADGNYVGARIDILQDQILKDATYSKDTNILTLKFNIGKNSTSDVDIPLNDIFDINDIIEGNGISVESSQVSGIYKNSISVKLDTNGDGSYFKLTSDGLGLSGITDAIDARITGLISGNLVYADSTSSIADSGMKWGGSEFLSSTVSTVLATQLGVQNYITNSLSEIIPQIDALVDKINTLSGLFD